MLITFKSKASANVTMYLEHAQPLLDLLHKEATRGVIMPEEAGTAIASLEVAIKHDQAHPVSAHFHRDVLAHHGDMGDDNDHETPEPVSLSARAYPLMEMLKAARQGGHPVLWGV